MGLCPRQPSTRLYRPLKAEEASHSEPGPHQLGGNPRTNRASVSSRCNGNNSTAGGRCGGGSVPTRVRFCRTSPLRNGPHSQRRAHSRRSGNALRKEERATSCPQADSPEAGFPPLLLRGHVAFLRVGVGAGRRCPPGPAPSGSGGRDEAPGRRQPAPREVGVARSAPHKVCFLPPGGWGRARKARRGGGGRRGDLTSGREVLSSRELSGRVSGPAGTRRALPAPPAPCQDARDQARGRVDGKAAPKSQCGAQEGDRGGRGTRGQLGKFLFLRRAGEGASSWRVRVWVCELGCL